MAGGRGWVLMDAESILEGLAWDVWRADHGRQACPDHAIPKAAEFCAWLPDCPVADMRTAAVRTSFLIEGLNVEIPGEPVMFVAPVAPWYQALEPAHYALLRLVVQEFPVSYREGEEPARGASRASAPRLSAEGIEALHEAWQTVDRAGERELLSSVFGEGEKAESAIEDFPAHLAFREKRYAELGGGPRTGHPLNPLVRAWQRRVVPVEPDRRPAGIVPSWAGGAVAPGAIVEADNGQLADMGAVFIPNAPNGQLMFPDFVDDDDVPALFVSMAARAPARGRGAPLPDRAMAEGLMLPERAGRMAHQHRERFEVPGVFVSEVVGWFDWNPKDYRAGSKDYGLALARGLASAGAVPVPLANGGFIRPVVFELPEGRALGSRVSVSLRLPAGHHYGASVDRRVLRQAGRVSAAAWRLYLYHCFDWNRIARRGKHLHLTRPELRRNSAGYLTGADGKVLLNRKGEPRRTVGRTAKGEYADGRVVETGRREPNPAAELYRVFDGPRALVRAAWPIPPAAVRDSPARAEGRAIEAARWLAGEIPVNGERVRVAGVRIVRLGRRTKTGNPHGFPWRVVPPWVQ